MCPAVMLEAHNAITDRLSIISEFTECSGGLRAERGADTMEHRAAQDIWSLHWSIVAMCSSWKLNTFHLSCHTVMHCYRDIVQF